MARGGHALVLGDGDPPTRDGLDAAWAAWDEGVSLVIAADGGARLATALGLRLDRWIGDGDSFPLDEVSRLAASGVVTTVVPSAKDESDLELAVVAAAEAGVARITVIGALGGARLDHELANVGLLAHSRLAGIDVSLLDARTRVRLVTAERDGPATLGLPGAIDGLVSLLPLDATVGGVTTQGLRYPLADEPLRIGPARGLSNVRIALDASVTVRNGRLLVIETPATVAR
jgi:thiamine pyrophosphokinase